MSVNIQWGLGLTTSELVAACTAIEAFCEEHGHDQADTVDTVEPALHEMQRRRDQAIARDLLDLIS